MKADDSLSQSKAWPMAFIHSDLDEYGLTPEEFRVYLRVRRRWSEEKGCCEGTRQMAEGIGMSDRTVRNCLYVLEGARLLRKTGRGAGLSFRYDPVPPEQWASPSILPELRRKATDFRKDRKEQVRSITRIPARAEAAETAQGAVRATALEDDKSQKSAVRRTAECGTSYHSGAVRATAPEEVENGQGGAVRATAGCGTAYHGGAVRRTDKENPMKRIPGRESPHTRSKAAPSRSRGGAKKSVEKLSNGASKNASNGGSRFTLKQCREYAEHLRESRQGITSPGGYATSIYRTGEADELIEEYLAKPPRPAWAQHYEKELREWLAEIRPEDPRHILITEVLEELPRIRRYEDFRPLNERLQAVEINLT